MRRAQLKGSLPGDHLAELNTQLQGSAGRLVQLHRQSKSLSGEFSATPSAARFLRQSHRDERE